MESGTTTGNSRGCTGVTEELTIICNASFGGAKKVSTLQHAKRKLDWVFRTRTAPESLTLAQTARPSTAAARVGQAAQFNSPVQFVPGRAQLRDCTTVGNWRSRSESGRRGRGAPVRAHGASTHRPPAVRERGLGHGTPHRTTNFLPRPLPPCDQRPPSSTLPAIGSPAARTPPTPTPVQLPSHRARTPLHTPPTDGVGCPHSVLVAISSPRAAAAPPRSRAVVASRSRRACGSGRGLLPPDVRGR